jgi:hypothetical protein
MRCEAIERLLSALDREDLANVERTVGTIEKLLGQRAASAGR